ncbi:MULTISPECIES: class D sortase [unclassified Rossellomorea]|uniref:class D sortase n=1 Tax=unclassified Rossellomorea TaxID=2837526 RepID=UPI002606DF6B|nr:class D sortase [uncultured Rossellomorea sp.]
MNRLLLVTGSILLLIGIGCSVLAISEMNKQEEAQMDSLKEAKSLVLKDSEENSGSLESVKMEYHFETGDVIGLLNIPKLGREVPIISGTHEEDLERGVGHVSTTKLPGQQDRIFLAGHRDTVFKQMGELRKGDTLSIQLKTGVYEYEIYETFIVDETDLSVLEPTSPEEILTLSTCYPFEYLSSTEERYIINARKVN